MPSVSRETGGLWVYVRKEKKGRLRMTAAAFTFLLPLSCSLCPTTKPCVCKVRGRHHRASRARSHADRASLRCGESKLTWCVFGSFVLVLLRATQRFCERWVSLCASSLTHKQQAAASPLGSQTKHGREVSEVKRPTLLRGTRR